MPGVTLPIGSVIGCGASGVICFGNQSENREPTKVLTC